MHETDATPFNKNNVTLAKSTSSGDIGYQSPFSRRLSPYRSTDARPFNTSGTTLNQSSSTNSISRQPTPSSRTLAPYVSNRSYSTPNTPGITSVPSTQSLPCANESSKIRDPRVPTYDTNGKNRGKVLVINNIKFLREDQERKGAETDEKNISKLFNSMGFSVDRFRNLEKSAMLDKVKKFKNDSSLKKVDISIVIIMSHGSNMDDSGKIIHGGFTQIYGIDDIGLPIDDILTQFSSANCPALAGKPKIFIFQCCRGSKPETLHNDAAPIGNKIVKKHGDMLIAFSTLPGKVQ
ncbi:hypothetical protein NQ314_011309 [Rhamnusium bicolor]|uniref:Caspase family p20 domain-containing protein n=1 Tax=Rhamnusium bicolor TaxID=1586634 RepID=A0AAV8XLC7_9CUCU|nr:hypothetical protein NQ314_011309 [Rhamnusium bicolor]